MYDYITNLITKELKKANKYITAKRVDEIYISLIYILYLSGKKENKAKIKELLAKEDLNSFYTYLKKEHNFTYICIEYINIKELLKVIKGQNYKELIEEFIKFQEDSEYKRLEVFKKEKEKILYINTTDNFSNYNYNDKDASYLKETINRTYYSTYYFYRILDEMLKLKRTYYNKYNEITIDEYDTIIINDTEPFYKYSLNKDNFIKDIEQNFYNYKGRIILKTSYNKISKFRYYYLVRRRLSKVILHAYVKNNTVYMEFLPNNNENISLILLNEELANNNNKLQKIIESNRNKKGTLIKVTPEDIRNNNYRISFKIYEIENIQKIKAINDIVDENTKLTQKLERLNNVIEAEVNKLLERTGG